MKHKIYSKMNKENNVFKDALGVKGLGFKLHGNHACNHGSHDGNHHGNYHDNHSNHHGNYHAEQLLFSCVSDLSGPMLPSSCSIFGNSLLNINEVCKVYGCQVVKFDSLGLGTC